MMDDALTSRSVAAARSRLDFTAFYRATWDTVYRPLAVILRDPDLAQEATDEAMTRAFQHWNRIRGFDNPTGWVFRVALNWSRTRLRRRLRAVPHLPAADATEPTTEPGLLPAVAGLPLRQREVVVLRYFLDWSEAEIADALRIPRGTVKSRLHRALARLRKEMT